MPQDLTKRSPSFGDNDYDDGFSDAPSSEQKMRTSYLRWTEQLHWTDQDGMAPPSPMLVHGISELVRRWKTIDGLKRPEDITTQPLPDPDELNRITPQSEWERQLDGSVSAGWKREYFVYFVNLGTGQRYTYSNSTVGAYFAWDALRESVITMRALRGEKCFPVVELAERPMKSKYRPNGMGMRPHFEPIGWRVPGGSKDEALPAAASTPQLSGPSTPPAQTPSATPATKPPSAKRPVTLSEYTLAVMGEPKPVTTEELLNDSLDDLPWDEK